MKNDTFNNILIAFMFGLIAVMFFCVLFGCSCKRPRVREFFANTENKDETSKKEDLPVPKKSTEKSTKTTEKKSDFSELSDFENSIIEGVQNGTITEKDMKEMIKSEKFTQENLANIISNIEKQIKSASK